MAELRENKIQFDALRGACCQGYILHLLVSLTTDPSNHGNQRGEKKILLVIRKHCTWHSAQRLQIQLGDKTQGTVGWFIHFYITKVIITAFFGLSFRGTFFVGSLKRQRTQAHTHNTPHTPHTTHNTTHNTHVRYFTRTYASLPPTGTSAYPPPPISIQRWNTSFIPQFNFPKGAVFSNSEITRAGGRL